MGSHYYALILIVIGLVVGPVLLKRKQITDEKRKAGQPPQKIIRAPLFTREKLPIDILALFCISLLVIVPLFFLSSLQKMPMVALMATTISPPMFGIGWFFVRHLEWRGIAEDQDRFMRWLLLAGGPALPVFASLVCTYL